MPFTVLERIRSKAAGLAATFCLLLQPAASQELADYETQLRPLLDVKCFRCHNTGNTKGGVNLDNYKEKERVIRDGQVWLKVMEAIKSRHMPPKSEIPLNDKDYAFLVEGINSLLQSSLKRKNPGYVVIRRLSHNEYQYTVKDLVGVDFDAKKHFPADGSGGGGFDNQARALFFTPLKLERYYDAADEIVNEAYKNQDLWAKMVPITYDPAWYQRLMNWFNSLFSDDYDVTNPPELAAERVLYPFAAKAYRKFLKDDEKVKVMTMFKHVYSRTDSLDNPERFNIAVAQTFKTILVSPNFLYRVEEQPPKNEPYSLSHFEVAARLSYFLWSSLPDDELFSLAYQGKLQDTVVLEAQVRRMLADPKARRFAESFSSQWLGIGKLRDSQPILDAEKFPAFDEEIREALYRETVEYFYYVLSGSKNMMELVNSNYTFLNGKLAAYYGIEGVSGDDFRKVILPDANRGGILGMGGVLAVTSTPLRTSPVLRGKWVMEQIMGISPPPPPPVVAELTDDPKAHQELGLRRILEIHRAKPECKSCHEMMDPLGLGLENFDADGRWRTSYGKASVNASGRLEDGRRFNGPKELKLILLTEKEKIARNLSSKMLSYAIGRSVLFTDELALRRMDEALLKNDFNPELFIIELVKSYPFRMKRNDFEVKVAI